MKPEHADWLDAIWERLKSATAQEFAKEQDYAAATKNRDRRSKV